MAAADYRLMTEATGQRIAAALEALHLATVTGVKGNAEANYRTGDVNITPANIGAVSTSAVIDIPHGGTRATTPDGACANIGAVKKSGDTMTGPLSITPPSGEGGEIALDAPADNATTNGITIDHYYGKFRIFGIPSKDGTTHTGYGVALTYDPYTGILASENGPITLAPGYLHPSNPLDIPHGGTDATTQAGARSNLGALGSFATGLTFGGSATNFYQNLGAQINTMVDYDSRIFIVYADTTSEPFYQGHIYSGTITRYANATCGGILADQFGMPIAIGCNNGTWSARSL